MPGKSTSDDGALRSLWGRHQMTDGHAILWTVIVIATVGDILLTLTGLATGLQEGNVFLNTMLEEFGLLGLWLVKFGAMCWLVLGWRFLSDRNATVFLALFAIITVAVVGYNSVVILQNEGVTLLLPWH